MEPTPGTVRRNIIITNQLIQSRPIREKRRRIRLFTLPAKNTWLLASALAFSLPVHGTAIAFLVESNAIFLAADGRANEATKTGNLVAGTVCKIRLINKWVTVASGLAVNVASKFDIFEVEDTSLAGQRTASAGMEAIKSSLLKNLPGAVLDSRRTIPKDYQHWLTGKTPVVSVALGTIESGVATLRTCDFFLKNDGAMGTPKCDMIHATSTGPVYYGMGSNEATVFVLGNHQADVGNATRHNPTAFVKRAVELEIAATRLVGGNEIGPPITSARFDAAGLHIIEPGACTDQGKKK